MLDLKTSEVCRAHDGLIDPATNKPYTYETRKAGENFPPLHPNCRSIAAPFAGSLEGLTRPARDPKTGEIIRVSASMTYEAWHKQYVEGDAEAELAERMTASTRQDRAQWVRYRDVLGKECPRTLAEFQRMKYTDAERWEELKYYYRNIGDRPLYCVKVDRELRKEGIPNNFGFAIPAPRLRIEDFGWGLPGRQRNHALHRMMERGLGTEDAQRYIDEAHVAFEQYKGTRLKFVSTEGTSVVVKQGNVLATVYGKHDYDEQSDMVIEVIRRYGKWND